MTHPRCSPCSIRLVLIAALGAASGACQRPSDAPTVPAAPPAPPLSPASARPARTPAGASARSVVQAPVGSVRLTSAPPFARATDLTVHRIEVAAGVLAREPVTDVPLRAGAAPIYAFLDVANASSAAVELVVTLAAVAATLPWVLGALLTLAPVWPVVVRASLWALAASTGALAGAVLPAAAARATDGRPPRAGALYAADFLGGAVGSSPVGAWLMPAFGVTATALGIAAVSVVGAAGGAVRGS